MAFNELTLTIGACSGHLPWW